MKTQRLLLRSLEVSDDIQLATLLGNKQIADTTANIIYPYRQQDAQSFIEAAARGHANRTFYAFAITQGQALLGVVSLNCMLRHPNTAELGYWIGVPFWGNGYATEAAQAVLDYAFKEIGLERVIGKFLRRNPASGRVLQKLGMKHVRINICAIQKWGVWEDEEEWDMSSLACRNDT